MKHRSFVIVSVLLIVLSLAATSVMAADQAPQQPAAVEAAMGTGFTYQGRLVDGGTPANGSYDFEFKLYDALTGGVQLGSTVNQTIAVTDGYFTTQLDFGQVFNGEARYLEIGVRPGGSSDPYTLLDPRQALTPVPYALALPGLWTQQNAISPNMIGGYNGNQVATGISGATISGGGSGGAINAVGANFGTVGGGYGNNAGGPIAVVGGGQLNAANGDFSVVAGGFTNAAQGYGSTVSGGENNIASALRATVGGGAWNTASGSTATIGGGDNNQASGERATVGGGYGNKAQGDYATVAGGNSNTAAVQGATVGGGTENLANGQGATVAGGGRAGAGNSAGGEGSSVGGGIANTAAGGNAVIAGGQQNGAPGAIAAVGGGFSNVAQGDSSTVSGGANNFAAGVGGAIGGGAWNSAGGGWSTVPGGGGNSAAGAYSFAAGRRAKALHDGAFVWGDSTDADVASTVADQFVIRATGGVSVTTGSAMFQINGGAAWTSANDGAGGGLDADLLDGQQGSYYQAQVSGTCAVGSAIRAINADGTVVCDTPGGAGQPRPPFALTTLDATGDGGPSNSMAIGIDGLGLIAYLNHDYSSDQFSLKVAHCSDVACTNATFATLDAGWTGFSPAITIGADGLGLISYYDGTGRDLRVAHCNDIVCTGATLTTLDSTGDVGSMNSVAIGTDGLGLISYLDGTNTALKVAHCNNVACTGATFATVDSDGSISSLAIGVDGLGLISYDNQDRNVLKVAHCSNAACTTATVNTVDSNPYGVWRSSLTIGSDGLGLITYVDAAGLKVAHCSNLTCSSSTKATLDGGFVLSIPSITVGPDGLGVISYNQVLTGGLETLSVAHCTNAACTSASLATVDASGYSQDYNSIAIGTDGMPLIVYNQTLPSKLKVAHCSNSLCVPYYRRR